LIEGFISFKDFRSFTLGEINIDTFKDNFFYELDKPICKIDDKRIFRLWGEVENPDPKKDNIQMHYFDYTVREWMPNLNAFVQEEKIVKDFVKGLKEMSKKV
jgi:hypothetical protein